jgi:hypothetical protein
MQISSVLETAASTVDWTRTPRQSNTASTSSSTAAAQTASADPAAVLAPASVSSFSSPLHNVSSSAPLTSMPAPYPATAGGKNYPGSVQESAGVYVASVPDPPGASASGATAQIAENNLEIKLDELA